MLVYGARSRRLPAPDHRLRSVPMRSASLPMYPLPETASATGSFWDALCGRLVANDHDLRDLVFEDPLAKAAERLDSNVVFTQFCGYPLLKLFRGRGLVLAAPCFAFAGCEGSDHCAFFTVRAEDPAERLEDLRGRVFGCNSKLSNTGMNLPRLALARIAGGRPFFRSVVLTGGHLASLDHLDRQTIDVCSIDCVTWGLFRKFRPADAKRYRILARTAPSPSLPYITSVATDAQMIAGLRDSLDAVFLDPATAAVRETLGLTAVSHVTISAYERLMAFEKEAADLGYPDLA
jgi:ABC-type phosphate/phosphonate transport system substrate-binding protein